MDRTGSRGAPPEMDGDRDRGSCERIHQLRDRASARIENHLGDLPVGRARGRDDGGARGDEDPAREGWTGGPGADGEASGRRGAGELAPAEGGNGNRNGDRHQLLGRGKVHPELTTPATPSVASLASHKAGL